MHSIALFLLLLFNYSYCDYDYHTYYGYTVFKLRTPFEKRQTVLTIARFPTAQAVQLWTDRRLTRRGREPKLRQSLNARLKAPPK